MPKGKREPKRILVTAALPYANGKIHLGHVAGAYLPADIYVRYQRSKKRDVLFICGSDEHGVPITITAEEEHTTPQAIVDRYHQSNRSAFEKLGISFDNYSRTSLPVHHETAKQFFLKLHADGILKEKKEKQLFDGKAGMFLPDRYVEGTCPHCGNPQARGDQCENCGTFLNPAELIDPKSKVTGETPTVQETTHWYFPLGSYEKELQKYIADANKRDGWKENVLQYCRGWFKEGLHERAVTRDLSWGVQVPLRGYENKVVYVWFEAVLGYISSTKEWAQKIGEPTKWKKYWLDRSTKYIAFIGKDNVVFHCIVFPAMLMAWNGASREKYILPSNVPANEFLNYEGQKFSKSRGWAIDVDEFLEKFPLDSLRYALAMNLPETRDSDFYWKDFQARNNNELADILGNFINRTFTFVHRHFGGKVPAKGHLSRLDTELVDRLALAAEKAGAFFDGYHFRDGTSEVMNLARFANKYFNDSAPWKTLNENLKRCSTATHLCLQTVRALAILCEPIIPHSSARIWKMLNLAGSPGREGWKSAGQLKLRTGHPVGKAEILFAKIEDGEIEKELQRLKVPRSTSGTLEKEREDTLVSFDEFKKIDIRVAKILSCEKVPKSEKLLKLQISLGTEQRQIVAGIAQHYDPSSLIGKNIIVVVNLQPARLMGEESVGMLLAATDSSGRLSIVTVDGEIAEGSVVQ